MVLKILDICILLIPSTIYVLLCIQLTTAKTKPKIQPEEDEYFMRIDDMIFMMKKARAGLKAQKYRWPQGIIPYEIEEKLTTKKHNNLKEAMDLLQNFTCIRFVERKKEKSFLYISHMDRGCYAHVGFLDRGRQDLHLGNGCWKIGTIAHELIHSIGFSHEHQRNDRDKYVTIRYKNVEKGKRHNFDLKKMMGMEFENYGVPYNYGSIMHYKSTAFSKNGKDTIIPKVGFDPRPDQKLAVDLNHVNTNNNKSEKAEYKLNIVKLKYSNSSNRNYYKKHFFDELQKISKNNETYYWEVGKDGRPVIGYRHLTWGDVWKINNMYKGYC